MTMKVSLVIEGDASGATAALKMTERDLAGMKAQAAQAAAALNQTGMAFVDSDRKAAAASRGVHSLATRMGEGYSASQRMVRGMGQTAGAIDGVNLPTTYLLRNFSEMTTMLISGRSPFQVLLTQGLQITRVFGPGVGVRGAFTALSSVVMQFASSPLALATVGLSVAAGAASLLFSTIATGGRDAEEVLESHAEWIDKIASRYKEAVDRARDFRRETRTGAIVDAQSRVQVLQGELAGVTPFSGIAQNLEIGISNIGGRAAGPFLDIIKQFNAEVAAGTPDVIGFRNAIDETMKTLPMDSPFRESGEALKDYVASWVDAQAKLEQAKDTLEGLEGAVVTLDVAGADAFKKSFEDTIRAIEKRSAALRLDAEVFGMSAGAAARLRTEHELTTLALAAYGEVNDETREKIRELADAAGEAAGRMEHLRAAAAIGLAREKFTEQIDRQVEAMRIEIATAGMGERAATRYRIEQELLNRAKREFGEISEEDRRRAREAAAAYDEAAAALGRTRTRQDWLREGMEAFHSAGMSFFSDFRNDLREGKSEWDAFADAGINALDRLSDRLTDMVLDEALTQVLRVVASSFGATPAAKGLALSGGNVLPFAAGGVIDKPIIFPMAKGFGLAGEAGPEAILPLRRGRDGRLGVESQGGGGATIINDVRIINNSSAQVRSEERQKPGGGTELMIWLEDAMGALLAKPGSKPNNVLLSHGGRRPLGAGVS